MTDATTITIPLWLPLAYLAVGVLMWLPLEYRAWRNVQFTDRTSFWQELWPRLRKRPYVPLAMMLLWPIALWEELR